MNFASALGLQMISMFCVSYITLTGKPQKRIECLISKNRAAQSLQNNSWCHSLKCRDRWQVRLLTYLADTFDLLVLVHFHRTEGSRLVQKMATLALQLTRTVVDPCIPLIRSSGNTGVKIIIAVVYCCCLEKAESHMGARNKAYEKQFTPPSMSG